LKISPTTNQVVATLSRACCPIASGSELWGFRDGIVRIDPSANRVVRRIEFQDLDVDGAEIDDRAIWLMSTSDEVVLAVDKRTGKELGRTVINIGAITGSAAGGGAVWITDKSNNTALRIDSRSFKVTHVPVQHPTAIRVAPGGVWVIDAIDGVLTQLSLDGGAVLDTIDLHMAEGNQDAGLAIGPDSVWITDHSGGQLIRVDLGSHRVVARIAVGPGPRDVAADKNGVWITR
ncbi:MAG TPA: hypothetical protein VKA30_01725, partial [Actinomycetota bacterium]|nr:hypothetical protein [Actinomycetota bacterium]